MIDNVVLVTGGREYSDKSFLYEQLDLVHPTLILHGGARGADALTDIYALEKKIPRKIFRAEWHIHGNKAGPIRNEQMAKSGPDLVVAFPGGRGTNNMVSVAKKYGIPVIDLRYL